MAYLTMRCMPGCLLVANTASLSITKSVTIINQGGLDFDKFNTNSIFKDFFLQFSRFRVKF